MAKVAVTLTKLVVEEEEAIPAAHVVPQVLALHSRRVNVIEAHHVASLMNQKVVVVVVDTKVSSSSLFLTILSKKGFEGDPNLSHI